MTKQTLGRRFSSSRSYILALRRLLLYFCSSLFSGRVCECHVLAICQGILACRKDCKCVFDQNKSLPHSVDVEQFKNVVDLA